MPKSIAGSALGFLFLLLITACFRNETSHLTVHIPEMTTQTDVRIATNAALSEVVGCTGSLRHDFEFHLETQTLIYHESRRLLSPEYRNQLTASLQAVGMEAEILQAVHNPLPPRLLPDGDLLNQWPDRCSAVLQIKGLDSVIRANIAADALAYVRNGGDDPRVIPNPARCELSITYNSAALSEKNIIDAIACSGCRANSTPSQSVPHGWGSYVQPIPQLQNP